MPVGGSKAQLLRRIMDELQGSTPRCPVTRAVRERVAGLQTGRMTQHQAKVRSGGSCWGRRGRTETPSASTVCGGGVP